MERMTIPEAARLMGRDRSLLRKWAAEGRIPGAIKYGTVWTVTREDLKALAPMMDRKPIPEWMRD